MTISTVVARGFGPFGGGARKVPTRGYATEPAGVTCQGPNYAGLGTSYLDGLPGTPAAWNNPNNITSPGDYADVTVDSLGTATSEYLLATNFGFSGVPDTATVVGVTVEVECMTPDAFNPTDLSVKLYIDGSLGGGGGGDRANGTSVPSTKGFISYGGEADTWGVTWNTGPSGAVDLINSAAFGVGFAVQSGGLGSAEARVYRVRMTVCYTAAEGGVLFRRTRTRRVGSRGVA